ADIGRHAPTVTNRYQQSTYKPFVSGLDSRKICPRLGNAESREVLCQPEHFVPAQASRRVEDARKEPRTFVQRVRAEVPREGPFRSPRYHLQGIGRDGP